MTAVAAVVTLLLVPWSIRIAHRFDIMAVPDARRLHPTPTPQIGGLSVDNDRLG